MKYIYPFQSLFLLLFICSLSASGQTAKYFTTENGLSNSLINKIYQDRNGFIWIATEWGLNKFDSNKFTVYNHLSGNHHSLTDNYARTIFEDSRGRIFVGLFNALMLFNAQTNTFSEIKVLNENQQVIHPNVTSLVELNDGSLLVGTSGDGIFIIPKGDVLARYFPVLSKKLSSNVITTFFKDRKNNIWIAAEMGGLYVYHPNSGKPELITGNNNFLGDNVTSLCEDKAGTIFIGTYNRGLFVYSHTDGQMKAVSGSGRLLITSLLDNYLDEILIGTDGQGVKVYDKKNNSVRDCMLNTFPYEISRAKVHSIIEDRDHNLWLGLFQKGIVFVPSQTNHFKYWGLKQNTNNPIGVGCVLSVSKLHNGNTIVAVDNEGIYIVDKKGKQLAHYTHSGIPSSVSNINLATFEDREHTLWLGSYTSGLCRLNVQTGECTYIPALQNKKVFYITEDKDGCLLVATYGAGFYRINNKTGEIRQFASSQKKDAAIHSNELPNNWINVLLSDRDGFIWIGHLKGLSCYDLKKKTYLNFGNVNNLLPHTVVISLMEARDGAIWVGTTDGLIHFNKKTGKIEKYTTKDNLANHVICGLQQDNHGEIWISTYHGISRFSPTTKSFMNFYVNDGIQGFEFTRGASYKDSEGNIYFGGTNGLTYFNPSEIALQKRNLQLLLTRFQITNKESNYTGELFHKNGTKKNRFVLDGENNSFSMEFSSMDYANSERIVYMYKLEGWDKTWMSTSPGVCELNFTNIPSGSYVLKIKAVDNEISSEEQSYVIDIRPPWWASWWAYLIYLLIAGVAILVIYRYNVVKSQYKKEKEEQERFKVANEARLRYFVNISHEIRTPMSLIISPLERLMQKTSDPEIQRSYQIIYRNAQRILKLISQLMDVRKLEKGQMHIKCRKTDIVDFVQDVMYTFSPMAKKKNIAFRFHSKEKPLYVWIDVNNFDKVLMNLFSNAFKFTPENGQIDVELSLGEGSENSPLREYFQITVCDTGIGIGEEHIGKIFERFYQVDASSYSSTGTGVGLHLARELVSLMSGVIYAEPRRDVCGSRFVIRMPLGCKHLKANEIEESEISGMEHASEVWSLPFHPAQSDPVENEKKSATHLRAKTNYKVLIVEDDEEIRKYLLSELSPFYKMVESSDGKDGYEAILAKHPDLVVSDIMMPGMDGISLCRKVKQNPNINHIPVILLTAKSSPEDRSRGLEIGADAYLAKPFHVDELISQINNLIHNRELLKVKFSGIREQNERTPDVRLKSSDEVFLEKVMNQIYENLSNPELNGEMLAGFVGISRVHLHRKLKELINTSSRDLIRTERLKQAGVLLRSKKLTVSEVAYASGFSNLSHFSIVFKEFYGLAPSDYMLEKPEDDRVGNKT